MMGDPNTIDAVVATVAYSDVFDMPAERALLRRYLVDVAADDVAIDRAIEAAVAEGRLVMAADFLHLPGREVVVDIAEHRLGRAASLWPDAYRYAAVLRHVPFVRMVAVTGGLAADSVEPDDDIDYLLATEPGRLWLARLLVVAVVKAVGLRGPELCPNFLLATDALELDVRSVYVARELAQSVPLIGPDVYDELLAANRWYLGHLPNAEGARRSSVGPPRQKGSVFQRLAESLLGLGVFDRLERWEMQRKIRKLTTVSSRRPEVGAPDESSFTASVCKGHLEGNAAGIDIAWRERLVRG